MERVRGGCSSDQVYTNGRESESTADSVHRISRRLKPPAHVAAVVRVVIAVRPRQELLFEPHLYLDEHDAEDEGEQRDGVRDDQEQPQQREHHPEEVSDQTCRSWTEATLGTPSTPLRTEAIHIRRRAFEQQTSVD